MSISIVKYYGKQNGGCGYCQSSDGNFSYGMHAYQLTPQDYQDLIDRGWRRCGHYCYKQDNELTCCPCYTIKCDAMEFKLTKFHKKIIERVNRFLRDGKKVKVKLTAKSKSFEKLDDADVSENLADIDNNDKETVVAKESLMNVTDQIEAPKAPKASLNDMNFKTAEVEAFNMDTDKEVLVKQQQQQYQKDLYVEDKSKEAATSCDTTSLKNGKKSLKDFIEETRPNDKHKLRLVTINVESDEFMASLDESYKLYKTYQRTIHNDPPRNVQSYLTILQKTPLKIVHEKNGPSMGYGTFHQQYWLDDKLIAVAVLDILPNCISSVYFFYDPQYRFLSLGTYSSLREIAFVQELAKQTPNLKNYYMGFYTHSCQTMRYKIKLRPSYLLCPEAYTWHLITNELRAKLDTQKYMRFNMDVTAKDQNEFSHENVHEILLYMFRNICICYGDFVKHFDDDEEDILLEYGTLVGKALTQRMLFFKNALHLKQK